MSDVTQDVFGRKLVRSFEEGVCKLEGELNVSPNAKAIVITNKLEAALTPFVQTNHKRGMIVTRGRLVLTLHSFDIGYDLGSWHSRVVNELRKMLKKLGFEHPSFNLEYRKSERCFVAFSFSFKDVSPLDIYRTERGA